MKHLFFGIIVTISSFSLTFAQQKLSAEILWKLKRLSGGKVSPDGKNILFELRTFDLEKNTGNTDLYILNNVTKTYVQLTNTPFSEMEATWGKDNYVYFLSTEKEGVQLWKQHLSSGEKKQVSFEKNLSIEGYKLSNKEDKVVFIAPVKMQQSLHEKYPDLPKSNAKLTDDLMYRHWNYWNDENKQHLFLFSITDGIVENKGIDILQNQLYHGVLPPFGGSDDIAFSKDDQHIVYSCKKLLGKDFALSTNSQLYQYSLATQTTSELTTGYKGYDAHPVFLKQQKALAWLSMAHDGFESDKNDLILRDLNTGKDVNITSKHDITVDAFAFSSDEKKVYLIIPFKGTKQLFELTLKTNELKQLTDGVFDIINIDVTEKEIICLRQSMVEPTDMFSFDLKTKQLNRLTEINKEILANITLPSVEQRWVETSDGQKMLVWYVIPPGADKSKKHPTLLYCQGGPQSMVSQFFSYRWNLALMASEGYVIVAPNRRGLPGFGQKWNDAISKDWGGQAINDYLSAIDYASKETFVDKDRLGAVGASYGGYSVYYLAGKHEGRFKTFISHCGLFNLESWYGTTEELFFANWDNKGPYWLPENKEYYKLNSPHNFVQNWDTPILVIHGGIDFRVPESEGMQAFQAARLKGLRSKYLVFPNEGHWITSPQNSILWNREFFEWLKTDLKP
jgi:dipeptidyl aminopeptidase/acylaminoacyl peptidase